MKTVVAAALGECVHVAGVSRFLQLAEEAGWRTVFLGPATPIEAVVAAAREHGADLVGVSYRLTPETGERLLGASLPRRPTICAAPGCGLPLAARRRWPSGRRSWASLPRALAAARRTKRCWPF